MLRECSPPTICHMSCVVCHVSCVICTMSHVTCHMSSVTCHMSHVMCHMSHFFSGEVVKLIGGGSVINWAYLV